MASEQSISPDEEAEEAEEEEEEMWLELFPSILCPR